MYKDKERQREANRQAKVRQRQRESMTKGMNSEGVTLIPAQNEVIPKKMGFVDLPLDVQHAIDRISDGPEEKAQRTAIAIDYARKHPGSRHTGIDPDVVVNLPEGYKPASELKSGEFNKVVKPGDEDYQDSGVVEYCSVCGGVLPRLEQPRQYPGKCLNCMMADKIADSVVT